MKHRSALLDLQQLYSRATSANITEGMSSRISRSRTTVKLELRTQSSYFLLLATWQKQMM